MNNLNGDGRIPIGIVGLGFGRCILNALRRSRASQLFQIAALCDSQKELAEDIGTQFGVPAYTNLDEMLENETAMSAVGLYTRPSGRAALIEKIVQSGRHVMTTKPFELERGAAERVLLLAQEQGCVVHLNSPSPVWTRDLQMIDAWRRIHHLGRLVCIRGDVWASYDEKKDGTWMDDPAMCPGGPMMRLGVYLINDIVRLAGSPSKVRLASSRIRTGRPTPDNAILELEFPGGALGSIYASFCIKDGDAYANSLTLHFEEGSIYRNTAGMRPASHPESGQLRLVRPGAEGGKLLEECFIKETSGGYLWEDFARAIQEGRVNSAAENGDILAGVGVLETLRNLAIAETMCHRPARLETKLIRSAEELVAV